MSDRQKVLSRLIADRNFRADYIRAKLEVLIPSQLRALRLRAEKTQPELAQIADMKQSRISAMETPGRVNFNLETLVRMAATHNVGMMVKFVPFSEMLEWENEYSQDDFTVTQLSEDVDFLRGRTAGTGFAGHLRRRRRPVLQSVWFPQSLNRASTYSVRPRQSLNVEAASQLSLRFEPFEQHTSGLVEMASRVSSTGAVSFNFQNTATGAQANAANAAAA